MKIDDDHLYYGAAVIQIAEHPSFTAINEYARNGKAIRCAYWVNNDIGVYLKYRTKPSRTAYWGKNETRAHEYLFIFNEESRQTLSKMAKGASSLFVGFVCVKDRQICCLPYSDFEELVERRRRHVGEDERQYVVVVSLLEGGQFRVYVTEAAKRNSVLGDPILVPRKAFPERIFS